MCDLGRRQFNTLLGGAAATVSLPQVMLAQQQAMPVIEFLHGASPERYARMITALRQGGGRVGGCHGDAESASRQRRSGCQSEQQPRRDRQGGPRRPTRKHARSPFAPLGRKKHETAAASTIAVGDPRHPKSSHYAAAVGKGLAIRGAASDFAVATSAVKASLAAVHTTEDLDSFVATQDRKPNSGLIAMPNSFTIAYRLEITSLAAGHHLLPSVPTVPSLKSAVCFGLAVPVQLPQLADEVIA